MFRTRVNPKISTLNLLHDQSVLAMGSCFAQHIGKKLSDYKFNVEVNPFGTLFNPMSIFKLVQMASDRTPLNLGHLVHQEGVFHHYDLHSGLSALDEGQLLAEGNLKLSILGSQLPHTTVFIYTFGTAIVYELNDTGEIVANCHKTPQAYFTRRMLEPEEIIRSFHEHYALLKSINSKARFILTVSPVRHQKESFEQNNVSKSILRIACEKLVSQHEDVAYFPAFEIMMDELRDYRFYAEDMLHPSQVAVDYIWQQFMVVYFNQQLKDFITRWDKIIKALDHRPFFAASPGHQLFIQKTIGRLEEFKHEVDISAELKLLKSQLK
ncbi:MAG: GSCFA domain-containing protein [Cyclobacteriaceae bacterium]|nr:GSCFA domain-containing protein [Cyclobacteriaceae bacterium]